MRAAGDVRSNRSPVSFSSSAKGSSPESKYALLPYTPTVKKSNPATYSMLSAIFQRIV